MVREEVVETAARDKARYLEDLACIVADEAAAQRARWDSSLAEPSNAGSGKTLPPSGSRTASEGSGARLAKPVCAPTMTPTPQVTLVVSSRPCDYE
jgi:hypothetical protein